MRKDYPRHWGKVHGKLKDKQNFADRNNFSSYNSFKEWYENNRNVYYKYFEWLPWPEDAWYKKYRKHDHWRETQYKADRHRDRQEVKKFINEIIDEMVQDEYDEVLRLEKLWNHIFQGEY